MEEKRKQGSQLHKNHRKRLRERIYKFGANSLEDHELLEALLTYSIPRKDTNPLGHQLLDTFNNISNIFESVDELERVPGVGRETIIYFKTIKEAIERSRAKKNSAHILLRTTQQCVKYFRENFDVRKNEDLYIVCLSNNFRLIKTDKITGSTDGEISIDRKDFANRLIGKEIKNVVVFHTHPHGDPKPSAEDISATKYIDEICRALNIQLVDHIIFTESQHFSFTNI